MKPKATLQLLSNDALFAHALHYKAQKGRKNLYISRQAIQAFLGTCARFHLDFHLYNPLLVKSENGVKSIPTGLEDSEKRFINDLRTVWQTASTTPDWQGYELYLLRNLPRRGIGFFQTAGFYPDFLLWLKDQQHQALAFIDPKGLVRWDEEKVSLLAYIRNLTPTVNLPLLAYIMTPTQTRDLDILLPANTEKTSYFRQRGVLFQDKLDYVQLILTALKDSMPNH